MAGVGGANSLEDIPAVFSLPPHSSHAHTVDSDSDAPHKHTHQRGAELISGKQLTDSDPLSDDSMAAMPSSLGKKCVAINTDQVEHFTHRLLPVQSPEFDNVMDQVSVQVLLQNWLKF